MNKYPENDRYSLEPSFDLLYDGKLLLTAGEFSSLRSSGAGGGAGGSMLSSIDERSKSLLGVPAFTANPGVFTPEFAAALDIFEIKAQLSREQLVHRWKSPSVAADSIVYRDGSLLLVRRKKDPYKGYYALPGGILDDDETLEECAVRELFEETGLRGEVAGLLDIFSDPRRDPRVRMVSAIFVVQAVGGELRAGDDASDALFMDIGRLPDLAYDHNRAVEEFRNSRFFTRQG